MSLLLAAVISAFAFSIIIPESIFAAKAVPDSGLGASGHWLEMDPAATADSLKASRFSAVNGGGVQAVGDGILLPTDGEVEFELNAPQTGTYSLVLEYEVNTGNVLANTLSIRWDGEEILTSAPSLWDDSVKEYEKNRYGNEIIPAQKMIEGAHREYVRDFTRLDGSPAPIRLSQGAHKFKIKNGSVPMVLQAVYLIENRKLSGYEEYSTSFVGKKEGIGLITIEAEKYAAKSDSYIRPKNVQNPALSPYNTGRRLLNTIDETSWDTTGQKILWEFDVASPGFYSIGFCYAQSSKKGVSVFRSIEIDGNTPFKELKNYAFPYTGMKFGNHILGDGKDIKYQIWLEAGKHTISMQAEAEPVQNSVETLKEIMLQINDTSADIKKLTGSSKDTGRTWEIREYIPDITERLEGWSDKLEDVYRELWNILGDEPLFAVNIRIAADSLRSLAKEPKKIPARLSKMTEGSGSATQLIGNIMEEISVQPLSLDRIYIFSGEQLPAANSGVFTNLWEGFKRFILSFFPASLDSPNITDEPDQSLNIWVNRSMQFVEVLQQLADSSFTPKTGIRTEFSVIANEQKLTLSNASRTNPDVALGISNWIPYDLAVRGALADLTQFDDFLPIINREYNLETLIPFCMDNGIYGVTETQDFYVLMYRKDILDKLKLPVPETWEDVKEMMPELQRHSMNFYVPMAGWSGLKPLYTTSPYIFQNGGSLFKPDGLNTNIRSEETVKGMELMTELFNIYSLPEQVPNFFSNFRYGTLPVGLANYGTYVALMNAAPEIAGLWEIAPSPGVKDKNGNIVRYQVASDRAGIIFENGSQKKEAWEFMKWWLSKDTQIEYAYAMQTRYGPEYMWNTANLEAFKELPFPVKHKDVILEQWKWTKEVPKHPAGYMVEREISNAWTDIVQNGENIRIALDNAALTADREMIRKMDEFGYVKDGKVIKEFIIPSVDDIRKKVKDDESGCKAP